jgi:stress responsive alpha/beta barrel protein
MTKHGFLIIVIGIFIGSLIGCHGQNCCKPKAGQEPMLAHNVYFTLEDNSPMKIQEMVDGCYEYLKGHDGEVFFAAGGRALDLNREVNVQDFDVALHIIFKTRALHDEYQVSARHEEFKQKCLGNIKQVRVLDSLVK